MVRLQVAGTESLRVSVLASIALPLAGFVMLKFALWVRKKFQQAKRLRFEKWFKFPPWSTQRKIGRLLPSATMDHCGFITVHGRESRIYRKLMIDRAIKRAANKLDFASKRHECPKLSLLP
jgi:hypothetical protein